MNPTPTGRAATPSADGHEVGEVEGPNGTAPPAVPGAEGDVPPPLPAPRSAPPLPRRARPAAGSGKEPARDPGDHPFDPVDEETFQRLLSGLREI